MGEIVLREFLNWEFVEIFGFQFPGSVSSNSLMKGCIFISEENVMGTKKVFFRLSLALVLFGSYSCEKEETGEFTAEVLEVTCGGTVIQFSDARVGEDWRSYLDGELYQNVALTGLLPEEVAEGQLLQLDYKEVEFLDGIYCAIGGLPDTSVEVWNVSVVE